MGPLEGVKVLDLSTVIAAPFCASLLADFGAEVVKIEQPKGGDPFRNWGPFYKEKAMRFTSMNRNKKSVTLDLRTPQGKEMFLKMVGKADVVVENFRPGTLKKWGIPYEEMQKYNKDIIVTHISGYGQTGPYAPLPGFGTPVTAFSGLTYISGFKDRPPVSPAFSLADFVAGLYACFSTVMALYHKKANHGSGQEVDVSLYEGLFRFLEQVIMDYDKNGNITERTPGLSGGSFSPGGMFKTKDDKWCVLVCSTDRTWTYLAKGMKREDLMTNPKFDTMKHRVANDAELEKMIGDWIGSYNWVDVKKIADEVGAPLNLIYSIKDIFEDPQYKAREDIIEVPDKNLGTIKMPGIVPKFSKTPGQVKWGCPDLGANNEEVYKDYLGLSKEDVAKLKEQNII